MPADTPAQVVPFDSDPLVPLPINAVISGVDNRENYEKAYGLWMNSPVETTPEEIATQLGISMNVLVIWMDSGNWVRTKERYMRTYVQAARMRDRVKRAKNRDRLVQKSLDTLEQLSGRAAEMLKKNHVETLSSTGQVVELDFGPDHLESCAQAVRASVELTEKLVGAGSQADDEAEGDKKTPPPLVVLVKGGGLPTLRNVGGATVVDTTSDN